MLVMKVLLTGAFGNVGQRALEVLLNKGYNVRCFDVRNSRNINIELQMRKFGKYEMIWGDLRDAILIDEIVKNIDCVIHLAAIIPPLAYEKPDFAHSVNVTGTMNLISAIGKQKTPPRFIYASSIAVHGNRMGHEPPTRVDDPLDPLDYDNYARHKVEIERNLRNIKIPWVILRFAAVTPFELSWNLPDLMYEIPLDQRIESVDSRDVALACANAVTADVVHKTLFIGGGKKNQMIQREYMSKMLSSLGIKMLPESAFKQVKTVEDFYHCDWMDTKLAQELLNYQNHTFDDFLLVFKRKIWFRRFLVFLFRPLVRYILIKKSPYYIKPKKAKRKRKVQKNITPTKV